MSTLQISVENNLVIGRFNGEGKGSVICDYQNCEQVEAIIETHNICEQLNPTVRNAKAIRV